MRFSGFPFSQPGDILLCVDTQAHQVAQVGSGVPLTEVTYLPGQQGVVRACRLRQTAGLLRPTALDACHRLGLWSEAIAHGQVAQAGFAANGQPADALGCQAWIAWLTDKAGDGPGAMAQVEAVRAAVAGRGGWQDDEIEAAMACTRLLAQHQDPRAADTLAAARRGLMVQAADFPEDAEREQFLQSTSTRREIQATWNARAAVAV